MPINVGVIGAGVMGADHVRQLSRSVPGARVAVVADLDAERAGRVAGGAGARSTSDAGAVIADPGVDAVVIASHDSTHAELVTACLDAGKPVLCEKPLAPAVDDCRRIVAADERWVAEHGSSLITLGFMRRFDPAHAQLRSGLEAGQWGRPLMAHCISRNVASARGATTASAITNSAIHELDSMPWLFGSPVREVCWVPLGRSSSGAPEGLQDPAFMMLRLANGVTATLELFLNCRYGYSTRLEVVAEDGAVEFTESPALLTHRDGLRGTGYPDDWRPRFEDAYRLELTAWIDSLATVPGEGGEPHPGLASAGDGLAACLVADALQASMSDGGAWTAVVAS
ncbi:Gfo/Idh/MocA family oxidoreductase [Zhihengliuella salsuginis]|uniref:Inositol 2-dehydrogenase n=1 Tax=Zhihengliuella salsuginis TaxID=578222 RepID=A0ABQ3GLQ5_9MICC|nr:Gfo/Idh/MocA family oxidoreductase [Zhihengliuella salsuginis]GHD10371.1 inositol 2-dehydrogenase [Zhihengliuella salsuginis]